MFPLSPSDRRQAAAAAELGNRTARKLDQLVIPDEDEFDAQITAVSGSDYSWLRQLYDPATGDFYPDPAGLSGDTSWMPAREMNNAVISTFPFYARLTRRAVLRAADGSPVYEFMAGGGSEMEIVEPQSSGATPPTGLADYRIAVPDPDTVTFSAGEDIWFWDANA